MAYTYTRTRVRYSTHSEVEALETVCQRIGLNLAENEPEAVSEISGIARQLHVQRHMLASHFRPSAYYEDLEGRLSDLHGLSRRGMSYQVLSTTTRILQGIMGTEKDTIREWLKGIEEKAGDAGDVWLLKEAETVVLAVASFMMKDDLREMDRWWEREDLSVNEILGKSGIGEAEVRFLCERLGKGPEGAVSTPER